MQKRDAYPTDSVKGACFLTGDYSTDEGIIDLDTFVDSMPPYGRLCVSPKAVRMLVQVLGWDSMASEELVRVNEELRESNVKLRQENAEMRAALVSVLDARRMAKIDAWVAS